MCRLQPHPTRSLGDRSRKVHLYISRMISILSNTTRLSMLPKLVRSKPFLLSFYIFLSFSSDIMAILWQAIHAAVSYSSVSAYSTPSSYGSSCAASHAASLSWGRSSSTGGSSPWLCLCVSSLWLPSTSLLQNYMFFCRSSATHTVYFYFFIAHDARNATPWSSRRIYAWALYAADALSSRHASSERYAFAFSNDSHDGVRKHFQLCIHLRWVKCHVSFIYLFSREDIKVN